MRPLPYRHVATGVHNSSLTGDVAFIGDLRQLSVSIETQTNTASRSTFVASNDDGLREALDTPSQTVPSGGWSILTTITQQGVYTFDPTAGFRWLNVFRPSASSATVTYAGRT
jgi:hypothetical protein